MHRPTDELIAVLSAAVGSNTADCNLVWQAFAQFGVGAGSSAVINADGSVKTTPSTEIGTCP